MRDAYEELMRPSVPVLKVSDVKKLISFADECKAACERRGEPTWHMPVGLVQPAYPVR